MPQRRRRLHILSSLAQPSLAPVGRDSRGPASKPPRCIRYRRRFGDFHPAAARGKSKNRRFWRIFGDFLCAQKVTRSRRSGTNPKKEGEYGLPRRRRRLHIPRRGVNATPRSFLFASLSPRQTLRWFAAGSPGGPRNDRWGWQGLRIATAPLGPRNDNCVWRKHAYSGSFRPPT